jgi:hypothetical protein
MNEKKEHFGYKQEPLIDLPEESYVVEILHQFLRVTDLLMKLLLEALCKSDGLEGGKYNPLKHFSLKKLSDYLKNTCKIEFDVDSNQAQMITLIKSMQGPRKKLFFQKLDLSALFPEIMRVEIDENGLPREYNISPAIEEVIKAYWKIHNIIREDNAIAYERRVIESMAADLMTKFTKVWHVKNITPYLHVTCFHLADQYELMKGNLHLYSTEGLEKLNDFTTAQVFRATNKKNGKFLRQLLERDQRLVILKQQN